MGIKLANLIDDNLQDIASNLIKVHLEPMLKKDKSTIIPIDNLYRNYNSKVVYYCGDPVHDKLVQGDPERCPAMCQDAFLNKFNFKGRSHQCHSKRNKGSSDRFCKKHIKFLEK